MKKLGQALNKFANGVAWVSFVGVAFNVAQCGGCGDEQAYRTINTGRL